MINIYSNGTISYSREGEDYLGKHILYVANGEGESNYENGDSYKGLYADGLAHGKGVYTYRNGSTLTGPFCKGLMHGRFILNHYEGTTRELSFHENKEINTLYNYYKPIEK